MDQQASRTKEELRGYQFWHWFWQNTVWPWVSHFTSWNLSSLIYKTKNLVQMVYHFTSSFLEKSMNFKNYNYMTISNIISNCEILQSITKDTFKCIFKSNMWKEHSVTCIQWYLISLLYLCCLYLKQIILTFLEYKSLNKAS